MKYLEFLLEESSRLYFMVEFIFQQVTQFNDNFFKQFSSFVLACEACNSHQPRE